MTKTNVQPIPSNFQHHDMPNNKTHVIKFRVTAEEKASLELTCKLLNLSLSTFIRRAIHNVKIEKTIIVAGGGEETLTAVYMSTLGNRPDLFPSSGYVNKYIENPPTAWEIPSEYLTDERFNTLITEAEKYLGYPYVWGGSSPSTSFDCSGFVSYVLTNSGLCNTGRLGAQGLYNISTPVSDPQPGDLVFFVGTYDTSGVSHVGIYVGDGMMLHCGDPIQYSNLNTSYWQSHFYAYGRPPYN